MSRPLYVALGSSMAAGPGIKPSANRAAGRSENNYPHLVAAALDHELVDATVSGATTANLLDTPQRGMGATFAPQIESLREEASLVTITIGGNDLGYIGTMMELSLFAPLDLVPRRFRPRRLNPSLERSTADYDAVTQSMSTVVERVRARAPQARIVLVDYLTVFGNHSPSFLTAPLTSQQRQGFVSLATGLAQCFEQAASTSGVELVQASAASVDHGLGSPEPWVTGFDFGDPIRGLRVPYHPNLRGMQAVADLVTTALS